MAITASDLALYGSTGRPTDDSTVAGGSLDTGARPLSMPLSSAQGIELISSSSGDVRTAEVVFRTSLGETLKWSPTIAGTCAVALSTATPHHLLTFDLSTTSTGHTVTLRTSGGSMIHTVNPGEYAAFRMFPFAYSRISSAMVRYEKLFLLNLSTEATLFTGNLTLTSDESTQFRLGVELALDSTGDWLTRPTTPGGSFTFADTSAVSIPSDLGPGEAIGIAIEQTLAAGATADEPPFQITVGGLGLAAS